MRKNKFQRGVIQKNLISVESGSANLEFMKYAVNYNNHITTLLSRNLRQNSPILDFGAGTGEFALRLIKKGFDVSVLEVEPNLAKDLENIGLKTETSLAEFSDSYFLFIYSLNVLEHIENDVDALNSIVAKLNPNGKLILYLPAFTVLFSKMDKRVGHYRRYSKDTLEAALIAAGLEIETMHYVDFLGFFATLVYKILPNRDGSVSMQAIKIFDTYLFPMNIILDRFFRRFCGKNVFVVARKKI